MADSSVDEQRALPSWWEYRLAFDRRLPCPQDLFEIGKSDPTIGAYLQAWRHGGCSWEAMLIALVCAQKSTIDKLMKSARVDPSTSTFIIQRHATPQGTSHVGELGREEALAAIKQMDLKLLATHGRTLVVAAKPNFMCMRWHDYIITSVQNEKLAELIREGSDGT